VDSEQAAFSLPRREKNHYNALKFTDKKLVRVFPEQMGINSDTKRSVLICLMLALSTSAVYYQAAGFSFVNYDDPEYVQQNPYIKNGITPAVIKWAFTTGYACFWHPVTWLSHALDWQLFGDSPAGHHVVSIILHIANAVLVFLVFKRMTNALWPSAFVAALFALHPMHVESVAWVSERKDVLSSFFWLLTMWAYVGYARRPTVTGYLPVVVFFALGMMSKPMLVTLPFVLLLLDYWPLGRFDNHRHKAGGYFLIIEKLPLFAIAAGASVVAFIVQKTGKAIPSGEDFAFPIRLANASISYIRYILKMIWPMRLAMFYPHPGRDVSVLYAVLSAILLLVVTILILLFRKGHRYLITGWFWYIGTLVPVIGIVQVGNHAMADRYSYITLTGLFIIVAWGLPELLGKLHYRKAALWTLSLVVLFALALCAHIQNRHWKNSITLCEHALKVTDNNYKAHFCITLMLIEQGRLDEAIQHCEEAIRINPKCYEAYNNLGVALCKAGRMDEAIQCYEGLLELRPDYAITHGNLGAILVSEGRYNEAIEHCRIALETMDTIPMRKFLGYSLFKLGRFKEAAAEYRKILSAAPNDPNALNDLGGALARSGEFDEAISLCNKALQIKPEHVDAHLNLGFALIGKGQFAEAAKEYEEALLIQPGNAVAHSELGVALFQQKKFDEAIVHFNRAIQIDPNNTAAKTNLDFALAEKETAQSRGKAAQ
jgi:Flp pilus assembly protein TadD